MRLAALILAALPLCGQISLEASPEPMAVTADIPLKVLGLWTLRACNDGPNPRAEIPEERIAMAAWFEKASGKPSNFEFITAAHAQRVLSTRQGKNKKQIAVDLIETGLDIALPLMGWDVIAASKKTIGAFAAGRGMASMISKRLQSQVPSIAMFQDELLTKPLSLGPLGCTTRTVFAAKMKKPKTVSARIP